MNFNGVTLVLDFCVIFLCPEATPGPLAKPALVNRGCRPGHTRGIRGRPADAGANPTKLLKSRRTIDTLERRTTAQLHIIPRAAPEGGARGTERR